MRIVRSTRWSVQVLVGAACAVGIAAPAAAEDAAEDAPSAVSEAAPPAAEGGTSLVEVAPMLIHMAKRYWSFYGDRNTKRGAWAERSHLFGDLGGARDDLAERGIYIDAGVTQFLQTNARGGLDTSSQHANGSADLWLWIDTDKAGLWPGGAVFVHGEVVWGNSVNGDTGALLPPNYDALRPEPGDPGQAALSEVYVIQALQPDLLLGIGKLEMAAWADLNLFANSERTQFTYPALVNNPIAGLFYPYTSIGSWLTWTSGKEHAVTAAWAQSDGKPTTSGLTDFKGNSSWALQYINAGGIGDLPGQWVVAGAYSNDELEGFRTPDAQVIASPPGFPQLADESCNYGAIIGVSQYFWVPEGGDGPSAAREGIPPVGAGVFARAGWAPSDRNSTDRTYSLGLGGYGALIEGRDGDQWGIGWAGSHVSDDLRALAPVTREWEHAYEAFYNFAVTPAVHLTLSAQVIRPGDRAADTALTLGARLQLDF